MLRMRSCNATILVLFYLGYILVATLYPFELTAVSWQSVRQSLSRFFVFSYHGDLILNVVLFIPLGVLLYHRLYAARNKLSAIAIAALVGAGASLAIEILQSVFHRQPQVFDVLTNALGAGAGAITAALWPSRFATIVDGWWTRLERAGVVLAIALLFGAIPFVLSVVQFTAPFEVWNPRFTFQLGNEATLNRPWLGKVYFVALYNRALSSEEIQGRYSRGPGGTDLPEGLVSLYTFSEGEGHIVHDRSGVEPIVDLSFEPTGSVRWLEAANGVEIVRPSVLRSREPARKIAAASRSTGELGIELWVMPRSDNQGGPARIVSFSRNPSARNFTLGQGESKIEFRLRTPVTGRNGSLLTLKTLDIIKSLEIVHLVATYKEGVERLYVNGREQPHLHLPSGGIIIGFGTGRTALAAAAYAFFYFFPVGFFAAGFFSSWSRGFGRAALLSTVLAAGMLIATELFQVFAFQRVFDIRLVGVGVVVAAALGVLGERKQIRD
jgi:glycopeptide antibiotics resistance protein